MTFEIENSSCPAYGQGPTERSFGLLILLRDQRLPLRKPIRVSGKYFAKESYNYGFISSPLNKSTRM
jgi:hypothetical protein